MVMVMYLDAQYDCSNVQVFRKVPLQANQYRSGRFYSMMMSVFLVQATKVVKSHLTYIFVTTAAKKMNLFLLSQTNNYWEKQRTYASSESSGKRLSWWPAKTLLAMLVRRSWISEDFYLKSAWKGSEASLCVVTQCRITFIVD